MYGTQASKLQSGLPAGGPAVEVRTQGMEEDDAIDGRAAADDAATGKAHRGSERGGASAIMAHSCNSSGIPPKMRALGPCERIRAGRSSTLA